MEGARGFIYLAEAPQMGWLKIGFSKSPKDRERQLSKALKTPISLLSTKQGSRALEYQTHRKFWAFRVHGKEWFSDRQEIRDYFPPTNYAIHSEQNNHVKTRNASISKTPLARAMAALDNNQSEMARICGVKQPSVWAWVHGKKQLPAEHVLKVEAATGVSRHDLRPDIYPRENAA